MEQHAVDVAIMSRQFANHFAGEHAPKPEHLVVADRCESLIIR